MGTFGGRFGLIFFSLLSLFLYILYAKYKIYTLSRVPPFGGGALEVSLPRRGTAFEGQPPAGEGVRSINWELFKFFMVFTKFSYAACVIISCKYQKFKTDGALPK